MDFALRLTEENGRVSAGSDRCSLETFSPRRRDKAAEHAWILPLAPLCLVPPQNLTGFLTKGCHVHETERRALSLSVSLFASCYSAAANGSSREEHLLAQVGAALVFHRRVLCRSGHPSCGRGQTQRRQPGLSEPPTPPFRRHDFSRSTFALPHREIPRVAPREELQPNRNL